MNNLNFVLTGMTSLRYFIPLVIAAKKRNITSVFYLANHNGKYNSVRLPENLNYLMQMSTFLEIRFEEYSDINSSVGPVFQIEGDGWEGSNTNSGKKIAITYMSDYAMNGSYQKYIEKVDHVLFPSRKLAEAYNCKSPKNIYVGSPKYDFKMSSREEICKKYGLDSKDSFVLYAFPKIRDNNDVNTATIVNEVKKRGFKLICKSRLKDTIPEKEKEYFDSIFYDVSWYPHTTMELLSISNFLINFESTTSKEAILLRKPILDFKVKPSSNSTGERIATFRFLYDYAFYRNINKDEINQENVSNAIDFLMNKNNTKQIQDSLSECIKNDFFEIKDTCNKILDIAFNVNQ
jgi:hypothetical protein|tara:strand:+ start:27600 stop:28643 length:1044 start_codon:yes stop_codon:yes gene_type:complete